MKRIFLVIALLTVMTCPVSINAEIDFSSANKHYEDAKRQYYKSLTDKEFTYRLNQLNISLKDFQKLTEKYLKEKYGDKYLNIYSNEGVKGIGSTHWEMQMIGFSNIPTILSGAFLKKRYEVSLLEYELAKYKFKNNEIKKHQLGEKKTQLKKIQQELQNFIDNNVNYDE